MKLNALLGLLLLSVPACEPGQQSTPFLPTQTRDSAGIQIVENAEPPDGSRLGRMISPEPTVTIGVAEYESSEEERPPRLWTVFNPEGRVLGYVETPEGLWIHEIGEDHILGTTFVELDVEHVQVWALKRSEV